MHEVISRTGWQILISLGVQSGLAHALPAGQVPESIAPRAADPVAVVREAARIGVLTWRLTTPEELKGLLGPPKKETARDDGDMTVLNIEYPQVRAVFGKMREGSAPFTLRHIDVWAYSSGEGDGGAGIGRHAVDIGEGRQLTLRDEKDLEKLDHFWGCANASLAKLDLRDQGELLRALPFDSRTLWPSFDRLPTGFEPKRLLDEGKDPGLGVRGLHAQGIDGRGMHMAIIDQPMKPNHQEYVDQLVQYREVGVAGVKPQMHGPPVASIAVGKTCGVAPGARLHFYAVPMWKQDNQPYCDIVNEIIERNERTDVADRIHVVSISTGMFAHQANLECWKQVKQRAAKTGIFLITCEQDGLIYGTSTRDPGRDPDDPRSYAAGRYSRRGESLLVPAGNRTTASHSGPEVYTYWTEAGLSWTTPYLGGLAVLARQIDPNIPPATIITFLRQTATRTDAGPVVDPPGFIKAVRERNRRRD